MKRKHGEKIRGARQPSIYTYRFRLCSGSDFSLSKTDGPVGDWTLQQINASDTNSVLYENLHEDERRKESSMEIWESRPESNERHLGHSSSRCLQQWAKVQKQVLSKIRN
ncbi:hypothetical protein AVEN_265347-1 [Araneus ventricosus]|uniref:Uncharacterized protein n=1 Tax=Araneus ventricosus TaxID=182803 RepID=A0A4Y2HJY4_ARAVE|nr:hypothetical protein AVEN_3747-1 [Araneus ventricosus]GBM65676.1 hypothetical protein AVEN_265347-1 [Araneus ventricosus]